MRDADQDTVAGTLRTTRIILGAIAGGPLLFLGVVLYLRRPGSGFEHENATGQLLTYASLGLGACMLLASALIPSLMAAQARARIGDPESTDPDRLLATYRGARIVGAAMLEGAALLGCVAYLLEGWWPALVVAGLFPVLIVLFLMPTAHGLDDWLEGQRRRLRADRV